MKKYWFVPLVLFSLLLGCEDKAPNLKTEDDKTIYALGFSVANNLGQFGLTENEAKILTAGLKDGLLKKESKVKMEEYRLKIQGLAMARAKQAAEDEKKNSEAFLAKTEKEAGFEKLESGLLYKEESAGSGPQPKASDVVKVHYHGTLTDGTVFDCSKDRGTPATFPLNGVIPCWTEGVQKMKVGGKSRLVCPSQIAYGDRGAPPKIKPGATLVFDVELLEIVDPNKKPEPAPEKKEDGK